MQATRVAPGQMMLVVRSHRVLDGSVSIVCIMHRDIAIPIAGVRVGR